MRKILNSLAYAKNNRSKGLPRECYYDPDFWNLERESVLKTGWHAVAREEEIKNVGDYKSITVFGEQLILVRSDDAKIRVLSRVCLHRGCLLTQGKGNSKTFTCPYHNRKYNLEGALIHAPLMEKTENFSKDNCHLPQVPIAVWQGFVFVSLDPEQEFFLPELEPYSKLLEAYDVSRLQMVGSLNFKCPWNWKVLIENFMESYHNLSVHSQTLKDCFHPADSYIMQPNYLGTLLETPASYSSDFDVIMGHLFPSFIFYLVKNPGAPMLVWYELEIDAPESFELNIHILATELYLQEPSRLQEALEIIKKFHSEDIVICDQVQRGVKNSLYKPHGLSEIESSIIHFHSYLAEQLCP